MTSLEVDVWDMDSKSRQAKHKSNVHKYEQNTFYR